jgi:hypothetical protein
MGARHQSQCDGKAGCAFGQGQKAVEFHEARSCGRSRPMFMGKISKDPFLRMAFQNNAY